MPQFAAAWLADSGKCIRRQSANIGYSQTPIASGLKSFAERAIRDASQTIF
jgi:hypothetical protein